MNWKEKHLRNLCSEVESRWRVVSDDRLSAAAPALLKALIACADELGSLSQTPGTDAIVVAARDAIENATGDRYAEA